MVDVEKRNRHEGWETDQQTEQGIYKEWTHCDEKCIRESFGSLVEDITCRVPHLKITDVQHRHLPDFTKQQMSELVNNHSRKS